MLAELGGVGRASPSSHRQSQASRAFCGQLQPPRGDEIQAGGLGHDGGQTRMAKPFLETGEEGGLVPGLDIDDPIRPETRLTQGRSEQVGSGDAPEHLALPPGRDPGGEEGGGGSVHGFLSSAGDFMESSKRKASARQMPVQIAYSERQNAGDASRPVLQGANPIAQAVEPGRQAGMHWRPPVPRLLNVLVMFSVLMGRGVNLRQTLIPARTSRRWPLKPLWRRSVLAFLGKSAINGNPKRRPACATSTSSSCRSMR